MENCELCFSTKNCLKCFSGYFLFDSDNDQKFDQCLYCDVIEGCKKEQKAIFEEYNENGMGNN